MLALSRTRTNGFVAFWLSAMTKPAAAARRAIAWPIRAVRARRELAKLAELSDHELHDFGLLRSDVDSAYSVGLSEDPTVFLARTVNERARAQRAQARELQQWARRRR